jgi:hypothetical protein
LGSDPSVKETPYGRTFFFKNYSPGIVVVGILGKHNRLRAHAWHEHHPIPYGNLKKTNNSII